MGLDTSHDCWHGPYTAFTRFRNKLAIAAGYTVEPVTHEHGFTVETVALDWARIERENPGVYLGDWVTKEDPLVYLIAHSDCDGVIHPAQAEALADRIEELLPLLAPDGLDNTRAQARRFIKGLRAAVSKHEDVDFH